MITHPRSLKAIMAMQHLCIMARFFTAEDPNRAFKILDSMDFLFGLLSNENDKTDAFGDALRDMVESVPQCEEALRIWCSPKKMNPRLRRFKQLRGAGYSRQGSNASVSMK